MALRVPRVIVLVAIALGTGVAVEAGTTPADQCTDRKAKEAGRYALSLARAFGRNGKVPDLARLASDLSSAQSKITRGFTKAEFRGSGVPRGCITTGDVIAIQAKADSLAEDVIDEIDGVTSTSTTTPPTTTTPTTTSTTMPETCTSGPYPTCGGSCPPGLVCQATFGWVDDGQQCKCVEGFACYSPACGPPGLCPPGEVCTWASHPTPVNPCGCAPPPLCMESAYPACGGNCPPGLQCVGDPFFGFCFCLSP